MTLAKRLLLLGAACAAVRCGSSEDELASLSSNLESTCQTVPGVPWLDFRAEPWQDIVEASVCAAPDGTYTFEMELAAAIPESPTLPPFAQHFVVWAFGFSSVADDTLRYGYPQPPGQGNPASFILFLTYDGASFKGTRVDRRELNETGEPTITPLAFEIDGSRISTTVSTDLAVDEPIIWHGATMNRMGPFGSAGVKFMDLTPRTVFP